MLLTIIFFILAIVPVVYGIYQWVQEGFGYGFLSWLWTAIVAFFVLLASVGIVQTAVMSTPNGSYTKNMNISAMSNASGAEGHTRGGLYGYYGYVGNERYIYFVKHNKDGSYELRQVNAKQARIYETATTETAHVEIIKFTADHPLLWPGTNFDFQSKYKFYVPKGTISDQNDFKVDNSK